VTTDRRFQDLERRVEVLERENVLLRKLLEERGAGEPVGLREAARLAGVSRDTIYRNPKRYGGWKVDPSKPKSEWRFDPERVRQRSIIAPPPPAEADIRRRRRRSTDAPLLPVKDCAA
jgi:hypothetical protein